MPAGRCRGPRLMQAMVKRLRLAVNEKRTKNELRPLFLFLFLFLGAAGPAVDLDAGRFADQVVEALLAQVAVQPEAVTAGLVATANRGLRGQAKPLFALGDLLVQGLEVPRPHGPLPYRLSQARREPELPLAPARFSI